MSSLRVVNPGSVDNAADSSQQELDMPISPQDEMAGLAIGSPPRHRISNVVSPEPPGTVDQSQDQADEQYSQRAADQNQDHGDLHSYDLKPPPPSISHDNIELLSTRFFSIDHLDLILRDATLVQRFARFLQQYRPQHTTALGQYSESRKAVAAIEYANALAHHIQPPSGHVPYAAATVDDRFEANSRRIVGSLVEDALPAYLTHRLVQLVTDTLVKEITGNNAPIMRALIPSLAEVYCLTDPTLHDNPIVYASEEFYNTTQYGREYVIGRNCRFLQGPKTSNASVRRLVQAINDGQEICETLLNYRRDGSPFMNLLMIAPLYDNKGHVRYFLGCQIDVSSLIEGGRGLESFAQLITQDRTENRFGDRHGRDPKHALGELSQMLTTDEAEVVQKRARTFSSSSRAQTSVVDSTQVRSASRTSGPTSTRGRRIVLGVDQSSTQDTPLWPHPSLGPSGRLPGVYQNYMLIRPYPSLRITFTSPALRIPGLLQTKFFDRIAGHDEDDSTHDGAICAGLLGALARGTGVTARITWLAGNESKPRWIHCTPLLGSDERVGVWMVVMVEEEQVTGLLNQHHRNRDGRMERGSGQLYSQGRLYADYLKTQERDSVPLETETDEDDRENEEQFRDF